MEEKAAANIHKHGKQQWKGSVKKAVISRIECKMIFVRKLTLFEIDCEKRANVCNRILNNMRF